MANRNKPLPARVREAQLADAALARHPGWQKWPLSRQLAYLFTAAGATHIGQQAEPHSVLLALWQLHDQTRRNGDYRQLPPFLAQLAACCTTLFTRPELVPLLGCVGRHYGHRVRELATWRPRSRNPFQQLVSLLRHLFDRYHDVPAWVLHGWGSEQSGVELAALAVYLGRGNSLRSFPGLPVPLSRRQAHWLRLAPAGCTFQQAYRYAQLAEREATDWLGVALASRLGTAPLGGPDDDMYLALLDLFRADPDADPWQFGVVCDYLHFRRRVGTVAEPAQPGFSLRGRTLAALLAQAAAWYRTTGRLLLRPTSPARERSWPGLPVPDFDAGPQHWVQVQQLCSQPALVQEGQRMHNCVASYLRQCELGRSGIFSLRLHGGPALTMQVTATRQLVQVRGKYNLPATPAERRWVHRWLAAADLTVTDDAWGD